MGKNVHQITPYRHGTLETMFITILLIKVSKIKIAKMALGILNTCYV